MTSSNLPALHNRAALRVPQPLNRPEPTPTPVHVPAPLRLSTALLIVSAIVAALSGVSLHAGRGEQAALVGGTALVLLFAAGIERYREHRR